jgi:predicted DNA-binding transcriptional regulator AlpA
MSTTAAPAHTPTLLVSAADLARALSVSVRTVWRMVAAGQLPQPIRFNRKLVRWTLASVVEALQQRGASLPAYPQGTADGTLS